jgi:hypothetical protein
MKSFKFQPVVWLTVIATVLGALLQVDSTFHVLPAGVAHWVAAVAAFVALLWTAVKAWQAATPVVDPKSAEGYPLAPVPPVGDGGSRK